MGNQGSALNDDDNVGKISSFDHSYKVYIRNVVGDYFKVLKTEQPQYQNRPRNNSDNDQRHPNSIPVIEGQLNCKQNCMEVKIDSLIATERKVCTITYQEIKEVGWDHSLCEVKFTLTPRKDDQQEYAILHVPMSIELESELQQRWQEMTEFNSSTPTSTSTPIPPFNYVGMFAGATKPKPFQRIRPNISKIPTGKLPPLSVMRDLAINRHQGCYAPCPVGTSRRINLALEHIFEGFNSFEILLIQGDYGRYQSSWTTKSRLVIQENKLIYYSNGLNNSGDEIPFDWISFWIINCEKKINQPMGEIRFYFTNKSTFGSGELGLEFPFIRDLKHTLEYFWNRYHISKGLNVMLGSTHGRPLETICTLNGVIPAPPAPIGQVDIVDSDGMVVRPGVMIKSGERLSLGRSNQTKRITSGQTNSFTPVSLSSPSQELVQLPPETKVRGHWNSIVKHQGWLLKKGGIGVKHWIKRYFVLYSTSQGHFLAYYSSILECPMYTTEKLQRNIIDISKVTLIRPRSSAVEDNRDEATPPHSFEIQTTEREWTLCAESQGNIQKWLQMISRAVDEDVAIIPDETHSFSVKAKKDPTKQCVITDYSTTITFSADAVCLFAPESVGGSTSRMICRWIYTDFYHWLVVIQNSKTAVQLNVFLDETFSQRMEFLFRSRDANIISGMLEYYIEKFMITMHMQLELDGSLSYPLPSSHQPETGSNDDYQERKLPQVPVNQQMPTNQIKPSHQIQTAIPTPIPIPENDQQVLNNNNNNINNNNNNRNNNNNSNNHDNNDTSNLNLIINDDDGYQNPDVDFLGFGSDDLGLAASSECLSMYAPSAPMAFSGIFKTTPPPASLTPTTRPLSTIQIQNHNQWYLELLFSSQGLFYDDGTLQIDCMIELRGSQGRITLSYRNISTTETLFSLMVTLPTDLNGSLRHQLSPLKSHLIPQEQLQQHIMMECLQPFHVMPTITISYRSNHNSRKNSLLLPVTVMSFNNPLPLSLNDYQLRWEMLNHPGQEMIEILHLQHILTTEMIQHFITSIFKFHLIESFESSTLLGAASLRTGSINLQTGETVTLGCLIKIEINNISLNSLKITCRTVLPLATTAISQTTKSLFMLLMSSS